MHTIIPRPNILESKVQYEDLACNDIENLELSRDPDDDNERISVFSAGVASRLNLFPFQRKSVQSQLSLYISPGGWRGFCRGGKLTDLGGREIPSDRPFASRKAT